MCSVLRRYCLGWCNGSHILKLAFRAIFCVYLTWVAVGVNCGRVSFMRASSLRVKRSILQKSRTSFAECLSSWMTAEIFFLCLSTSRPWLVLSQWCHDLLASSSQWLATSPMREEKICLRELSWLEAWLRPVEVARASGSHRHVLEERLIWYKVWDCAWDVWLSPGADRGDCEGRIFKGLYNTQSSRTFIKRRICHLNC